MLSVISLVYVALIYTALIYAAVAAFDYEVDGANYVFKCRDYSKSFWENKVIVLTLGDFTYFDT